MSVIADKEYQNTTINAADETVYVMKNPLTVVGIGPGGKEYLTFAALAAIEKAEVLIGGQRNLDLFAYLCKETFIIKNNLQDMLDFIKKKDDCNFTVTVLASGDPGIFGILNFLRRHFPPESLLVLPGISSIQLACSRLALPWHDAVLTSTHGRDYRHLINTVRTNKKVIALTNPNSSPSDLARLLIAEGIDKRVVYLCRNLSYPDEQISMFSLEELADLEVTQYSNNVMVILDDA
ncbi:precorrin-6y C5,15-methyltransferase (decarboxylating), CbiE subunit [Desulfofarcimen acetoxidans DSM 771]|jgi:cobalt-precorrin-7 (C5)-methyltransferase|uniref:Precorrin-6y C5,15-methyltransferase (Decarboxylating), CbiE subunit n=1 Tax=Desulfofarcimen acetoxidans (strain ATCC 49208 / DSM 771 / KCTC 5769 / VKM B-1644 / 5575) TaxID=485916 RepID=C8W684_DESAS|nr:precorrin-6y C5,15-methyltransferase (decarboxylating) subunit CbiE [Desulfofarcimen acetoxidans]ACV62173.1 precorrin-6y C5,15-methyltransferase (decarboxylating), CbiE subunit [Desulfofarcimen acetoxidans DSM 771]